MLTLIKSKCGLFYIINLYGDIVASGNDPLKCFLAYCGKYEGGERDKITIDRGKLYYDERDIYIPESRLKADFDNMTDDEQEIYNYDFTAYVKECTGKNGTLKEA